MHSAPGQNPTTAPTSAHAVQHHPPPTPGLRLPEEGSGLGRGGPVQLAAFEGPLPPPIPAPREEADRCGGGRGTG